MTKHIVIALTAAAFLLSFAAPASADHQKTVKVPTVTAQGGSAPTAPVPQTPVPSTGG